MKTEHRTDIYLINTGQQILSCRHHDLINCYGVSVSQMTTDMFRLSYVIPGPFLIHDLPPGLQLE